MKTKLKYINQNVYGYKMRMTGIPPEQAIKVIKLNPNEKVIDIKKKVINEYKLNPILSIELIFKGKVLPDDLRFARVGINPNKDVITIMAVQRGGGM